MSADLQTWLDNPLAYQLGWALLHFLWQGALVGVLYAALRRSMANQSPQTRYLLGITTLASLVILPIVTLVHMHNAAAVAGAAGSWSDALTALAHNGISVSPLSRLRDWLRPLVPWTVPAWSMGVALVGARYLLGWRKARRLMQHAAEAAPEVWQQTVGRLATTLGVRVSVQLTLTARVAAPCVVGWLKPVILLPPATLSGLSALQLEMLLAHELAHIRRYDYLVNLLQAAVETLLFYHPVVGWISRDVRRERELCCDDMAVRACGDAVNYAHALADLAALRLSTENFAMTANGGDLTLRVERLLLNPHLATASPRFGGAAFLATLCTVAALGIMSYARPASSPLPFFKNFGVSTPRHVPQPGRITASQAKAHADVVLERGKIDMPVPANRMTVQTVILVAAIDDEMLTPLAAPAMPMVPADAAETTPAADSSTSLAVAYPEAARLQNALDSRQATAAIQIIPLHPLVSDPVAAGQRAAAPHHFYCEPLTGSRVCR
jgi:beta-lactamase regulating signal transducer with metallopeptidase domain